MKTGEKFIVLSVVICAFLVAGQAQVVREEGTISIAGLLESTSDWDEFWFETKGGEIIFASIDSSIYQSQGRGAALDSGCGEESTTATTPGTTLEGGCSHDSSGGCSGEGGHLHIKLELFYFNSRLGGYVKLCHAGRPVSPGWQRDPRLICVIPETDDDVEYVLKVKVGGMGGEETAVTGSSITSEPPIATEIPYLLNVSLRKVADSGKKLEEAAGQSKNIF
jgi:hypothetical protein